jgi:hypothetical protein
MKKSSRLFPIVIILFLFNIYFVPAVVGQEKALSKKSYQNNNNYFSQSLSLSIQASNKVSPKDKSKKDEQKLVTQNLNAAHEKYSNEKRNNTRGKNKLTENYFHIDDSENSLWDGRRWEESRLPLKIYVEESSSKFYKPVYKKYVKYALDIWRTADDRIQYNFVKNINDADIAVIFNENLGDEYEEDYLGLTEYNSNEYKEIEFSKVRISLIKNGNEIVSAGEIKATLIHELGHAFGLGHSKNKNDLMYPYISPDHLPEMTYDELSKGDKLAIKDVINLTFEDNYVWK